jgi:hypothetical protein
LLSFFLPTPCINGTVRAYFFELARRKKEREKERERGARTVQTALERARCNNYPQLDKCGGGKEAITRMREEKEA